MTFVAGLAAGATGAFAAGFVVGALVVAGIWWLCAGYWTTD